MIEGALFVRGWKLDKLAPVGDGAVRNLFVENSYSDLLRRGLITLGGWFNTMCKARYPIARIYDKDDCSRQISNSWI